MNRRLALALMVLGVCGCIKQEVNVQPTGETASLALAGGATRHGELWSVSDSMVVFESEGQVLTVPWAEIARVQVEGYSLRKQRIGAMIAPLVVYSAASVAPLWGVFTTNDRPQVYLEISALSVALVATTIHSFLTGDPKTDFRSPLKPKDLAALRLYCRYPQGLTDEQLAQLRGK